MQQPDRDWDDRIRVLEHKVQALRVSRRVLMTLLETREEEYRSEVGMLRNMNERLRIRNARYARRLQQLQIELAMVRPVSGR